MSDWASLSADGRYVAFHSSADNLVDGDTNGRTDIFVYDRQLDTCERVNVATNGTQGDDFSWFPSISGDGRYVAFHSQATNLVANDTNSQADIFVHDRQTHTTERVSVASDGSESNGYSTNPSISADGRFVSFESEATNLVPGDSNEVIDAFVYDRQSHTVERVSVASDGTQGDQDSTDPAISGDGLFVTYQSFATNLVGNDTNATPDIFVYDRTAHTNERVSVASDGSQASMSLAPAINGDGRFVAFQSYADNLVSNDTNSMYDVFVYDRQTDACERVSIATDGTQANYPTYASSLSSDGRYVGMYSYASSLVPTDSNGGTDIFIYDRQTDTMAIASNASDGSAAQGVALGGALSADGAFIGFLSDASNLVAGDTNGNSDVFVAGNPFVTTGTDTAPTIASLTANEVYMEQGATLTLTANNVADVDVGDAVTKVEFYRDVDSNGTFDTGIDTFLGEDTTSTDGFTWVGSTVSFPIGPSAFFARAYDGELWSQPVSDVVEITDPAINEAPYITNLGASPNPIIHGQTITLTDTGVGDPDPGDIVEKVEFYLDANTNGLLDVGTDTFLGEDTNSADGWTWTGSTAGFPLTNAIVMSRAYDGELWSIYRAVPVGMYNGGGGGDGTLIKNKGLFVDSDGDKYTVVLSGPGTIAVGQDDPDDDGKGPISLITLQNTTIKSSLTVSVTKVKTGDGIVTIGAITGNGPLKSIAAVKSDLTGTGIDLTGQYLGLVKTRNIADSAKIIAGGTNAQKSVLLAGTIGSGLITYGSQISTLKAVEIGATTLTTPAIGSLVTTGSKISSGAMNANLELAGGGTIKTVLTTLSAKGAVGPVTINANGPVGVIKSTSVGAAQITAKTMKLLSVKGDVIGAKITLSGASGVVTTLASMIVGGSFSNSNLIVQNGNVNAVLLGMMKNSGVFVGIGQVGQAPISLAEFAAPTAMLKSLVVKGVKGETYGLVNGRIVAGVVNTIVTGVVDTVTGSPFVASDRIKLLVATTINDSTGRKEKTAYKNLDDPSESFEKDQAQVVIV